MTESKQNSSYTLSPSWKYFFFYYLLSVVTIPLLGAGLVALYFVRRKHKSISYRITNTVITAIDHHYQQNIDLIDIKGITIEQSWLHKQWGIGSVVIHSSSSNMILVGLEQPKEIKNLLEQAAKTLQNQAEKTSHPVPPVKQREPRSMERINYITGLWQQGLLSDEDYRELRKEF